MDLFSNSESFPWLIRELSLIKIKQLWKKEIVRFLKIIRDCEISRNTLNEPNFAVLNIHLLKYCQLVWSDLGELFWRCNWFGLEINWNYYFCLFIIYICIFFLKSHQDVRSLATKSKVRNNNSWLFRQSNQESLGLEVSPLTTRLSRLSDIKFYGYFEP